MRSIRKLTSFDILELLSYYTAHVLSVPPRRRDLETTLQELQAPIFSRMASALIEATPEEWEMGILEHIRGHWRCTADLRSGFGRKTPADRIHQHAGRPTSALLAEGATSHCRD